MHLGQAIAYIKVYMDTLGNDHDAFILRRMRTNQTWNVIIYRKPNEMN